MRTSIPYVTETLRWSSAKFVTKATDTPARTPYLNCIARRPSFTRTLHGPGRTFGPVELGTGEFALKNGWNQAKGVYRLDSYKAAYRFNGAAVRVYLVEKSSSTYESKTLWATAIIMGEPDYRDDEVVFTFADREGQLQVPVLAGATWPGTNGAGGQIIAGGPELKGVYQWRAWGNLPDMPGQLVNTGLQIYYLGGTFKAVSEIRDSGLATFSVGGDIPSITALASATLSSTEARTCNVWNVVRLGSVPRGEVRFTVDGVVSTAASIIEQLVAIAGWSGADLTASTLANLAAANSRQIQLLIRSGDTFVSDALDDILRSIGGYRMHERTGTMTLGITVAPTSGAAIKTITAANSGDLEVAQSQDTNRGLPPYRTRVGYYKRYDPLSRSDFVAGVTASAMADQMAEQRYQEADGGLTYGLNPQSEVFEIPDTLHVTASGAQALASSEQDLRGPATGRNLFYLPLPLDQHTDLDPGDVVMIQRNRFDLTGSGKPAVITTMTEDLEENEIDMEAYG